MAKKVLTHNLLEPLGEATAASIDINAGTGNLAIGGLAGGEQVLASGVLEYMEGQEPPLPAVNMSNGKAALTLRAKGGRQASFRMPWAACNAETSWEIRLNPAVACDIAAHSGGGNVKLDLSGMVVSRVCADTGGGNLDVVLPEKAFKVDVAAKSDAGNVAVEVGTGTSGSGAVEAHSGAGNVTVRLPRGLAARIHATTGMGKVIIDPRFTKLESGLYQSDDYDRAADKLEISIKSGAGNVSAIDK